MKRLLVLSVLLSGASALAQPEGLPEIELERLTLNPSASGSLLLGTGELLQRGGYRLSLTGHYENDPLVLFEDGLRVGSVVKHRVTGHLSGAYGLTRWLELSAQVPLVLVQRGDDLTARQVGRPAEGPALGTPYVGLRLALLSQRDDGDAVDLAVGVNAGLPVGNADALARESSLRTVPSIMVGRSFGLLRAALDAGVALRPRTIFSNDANVRDEVGDELRLGAALATTGEGLRGEVNVIAYIPFRREGNSVEALAGARLPLTESLEAYALAGVGFDNAPGTPTFRGLLGVAFGHTPPKCVAGGDHTPEECPDLDDDNDGVLNRADACPKEGGKVDAQGCPIQDADGDGVLDSDDRCPSVAGDAVLQGCPDTDKDGIEDAADTCPSVFGLAAFQGCPDTDKDGLQDSQDKCPTEAGPADRQGCPPRDADKDGILDEQDACPNEAGIPELKGCPAKDADNDTVADHLDNCPNEAGPVDNQGCPAQQKQQVVIKTGRIELKDTVYFDTAKATIQRRSFKLLDQVAKILIEHPELEKVSIEGHTDSQGKPAENLKLSQRRAESVRSYLIKKGVAAERLEAKGFGQERPIADNKTAKGRAANRRVEFLTTQREGAQQ
ncbi:OmpA family protein [Hyalangium sp. s54d21]|uniref:OmpA family protein n=1 Tax=Hyalangium rubrum TaxID=3103134 RepID=A0ABU5HCY3_9BACT|nr:OmpA family protein [Hyalangium sp. s54d21]MDY7231318.1 OmpA family protein [Hyalangium sp. s54d21]